VLHDLGVTSVRLLTNNPDKLSALEGYGITVRSRVPLPIEPHPDNARYLVTKRDRMGHVLEHLDGSPELHADPPKSEARAVKK
jgi:3,4-dihydroxy 2-butanone 4-phosphate synthase/GTP cyclohydrolase II